MKSNVIKIIIGILLLGIFNLIFFCSGIALTDANWCTYAFVTAAFICLATTPLFARGTTQAVLSGSLWLRASCYFFTEIVVATICLALNPETITWPLVTQSVLLAIFLILQLMSTLANDATEASISVQKNLSFAKQTLIEQLQISLRSTEDLQVKKLLNQCIDAISFSPLNTCQEACDEETKIAESVNELCFNVNNNDFSKLKRSANSLMQAIQNRNLIVKKYTK
ncbi:MAG: hypothetical protein NC349_05000 [Paenibacillus sp.]|nr:hypothetical protein [Paenibacillus sp.]